MFRSTRRSMVLKAVIACFLLSTMATTNTAAADAAIAEVQARMKHTSYYRRNGRSLHEGVKHPD